MTSLRARLFVILTVSTGIVWLTAIGWIYFDSRHYLEHLLDTRLTEAARMVSSLVDGNELAVQANKGATPAVIPDAKVGRTRYESRLSCQIWSFDGRLVGRSSAAPSTELTDQASGFSDRMVDGEEWRIFSIVDYQRGIRVLVGDSLTQRARLVRDIIGGLAIAASLILPALALLIWASLGRGLKPLRRATQELGLRDAEALDPIEVGHAPSEIRPLISALNSLFGKVVAAREHERSFLAYAAHELRTPLAGLRTQVQIALAAKDEATRDGALRQTLVSVDRTGRLVRQLLTMSQLDGPAVRPPAPWIRPGPALREMIRHLESSLAPQRVELADGLDRCRVAIDAELFELAARNLTENALEHSPRDGTVRWSMRQEGADAVLSIEDEGPGIPRDEIELVTQRFYRGRHKSTHGSGLGLAIVTTALDQAGAKLRLLPRRSGTGLMAEIVLAQDRVALDRQASPEMPAVGASLPLGPRAPRPLLSR
ncbi:two-component system, OmpR family, sensor histidine kinase QseC [Rhizobiales bacterium GAS191]|nr:two-component system, OmpR family, sensor histidine kinase QseC [Rhizobiales bacterium GAS113]SED50360.1 two-component system, OmpR family, sensor histidine kinase QseC [Rhizobiales bacterium GAS188]SEE91348.1 two-component system, OmpR family, sensor histidine kinase QseC [Rhizobiales bacterium GAS191]